MFLLFIMLLLFYLAQPEGQEIIDRRQNNRPPPPMWFCVIKCVIRVYKNNASDKYNGCFGDQFLPLLNWYNYF